MLPPDPKSLELLIDIPPHLAHAAQPSGPHPASKPQIACVNECTDKLLSLNIASSNTTVIRKYEEKIEQQEQEEARVTEWKDLPSNKESARFRVISDAGDERVITLSKNKRRILEGLMKQPIYAASPVRISDVVHLLKGEQGLSIKTEMYANDRETDRAKFGVYFLTDQVERIGGVTA